MTTKHILLPEIKTNGWQKVQVFRFKAMRKQACVSSDLTMANLLVKEKR